METRIRNHSALLESAINSRMNFADLKLTLSSTQ